MYFRKITANLYIDLIKSDLSPQFRVDWSDTSQTFYYPITL